MTPVARVVTNGGRFRGWAIYVAAWVPVALFFAMLMARQRPLSVYQALFEGFGYVVPPAVLGAGVWRLTGVFTWPPRSPWRFILVHAVSAVAMAIVWLLAEVAPIVVAAGLWPAIEISKTFAGFQALDGIFVYGLVAATSYAIRIATSLREQEARTARADALRTQAELSALRGQLNPHFLFNTLHTLTALVRREPSRAENALERFADMLRYVLDVKRSNREDVTLGEEMEFVRNYLSLEQLRLGDRLRIVEHIDPDALECVLPSLTLQPLVENAIKYGIAPRAGGGSLTIAASFDNDALMLEVADDGAGTRAAVVAAATGVGLRAVRQRLETRYPGSADFAVTTAPSEGFVVRMRLPARTVADADPAPLPA